MLESFEERTMSVHWNEVLQFFELVDHDEPTAVGRDVVEM